LQQNSRQNPAKSGTKITLELRLKCQTRTFSGK